MIPTARLGRSDIEVTRLGFGGAPIASQAPGKIDEGIARATLEAAWECGVRHFDTAPLYGAGQSERWVGAFLATKPRDSFVLSTKVGRLLVDRPGDPSGSLPDVVFDFSADGVRASLEASLERLGLDRVDIALVHDPDDHFDEAMKGAYPALHGLRDAGVVRAIGAGMNQAPMLERFVRETDIDCLLVAGRYSLLDDRAAAGLFPACLERGVGVLAGGVFNSGILANLRPGATFNYQPPPPEIAARAAALGELTAAHGVSLAAAAIQFPLRHPAVTSVVVGSISPGEVRENASSLLLDLPDALWDDLEASGLTGWR